MSARSSQLHNKTEFLLTRIEEHIPHGKWGATMRLRASHLMGIALLAGLCGSDLPAASRKVPALPPDRQPCANVHLPGAAQFHREWMRLGGPGGPMGCPTQIKVHPDGGGTITLQNGEISVSPNVWERGVVAAYQDWDNIVVDWTVSWDEPLPPSHFNYDEFLVRWDYNGKHFDGGVDGKPAVTAIHLLDLALRSLPVAAQLQVPHLTA